ncbi:MAG: NAD(P)/FAD-dependent oxidoreductase [Candidatus Helarchaeota archaeon]|nr:NAD(P)/FAD-dependent oxidoreductase [Candidatus Helarchaeota archaeon]
MLMKKRFDIIVVGAGPAGSTAAFFLAEKFHRSVLLIDKERFPRDKPCGGYLTKRVFERFNYLKAKVKEITEVPTYGSFFYGPDLSKLEWIKEFPVGYLALRIKFDDFVKNLAVTKGAEILEGNAVENLLISETEAKVLLRDGTSYTGDIIIGADGARSLIAKKSQITGKSSSLSKGVCVVNEFEVPTEDIDEIYGDKRPTHYFYGFEGVIGYSWVFPKKHHINIGIGGPSNTGREIGQIFPRFLKFLREKNMIPASIREDSKFKAAIIPPSTALYLNQSYSNRVLLVGDALGVVSSISGEGIYQSMASGEDAARIANEALDEKKFDASFLSRYEKIWKKDLGGELKMAGNIMTLGSSETKEELMRRVGSFFEKMKDEHGLFDYFANTFFSLK